MATKKHKSPISFKKITAIASAVSILSGASAYAKTMEISVDSTDAYISGATTEGYLLDSAPYIENSRTLVPVRFISENFGADVSWDESEQKVTITTENKTIELIIGNNNAYVNGEAKTLDTPPVISNNRTMVPIRFVSEELGKYIEYIEPSKQILISDVAPILEIGDDSYTTEDLKYIALINGYISTPEAMAYLTPTLVDSLKRMTAVYASSKANANPLISENVVPDEQIAGQLTASKEDIYPDMLLASAIKMTRVNEHANSYLSTMSVHVSPEEIDKAYKENYVCAKHILVPFIDLKTGEPLDEKGKADAKKTADEALKKAKSGEDFDALIAKYNKDPGVAYNPDGYVFTYNEMVAEFETAAFELEENEISDIVETSYGYHIIKKMPLPEIPDDIKSTLMSSISSERVSALLDEIVSKTDIKVNMTNEEISAYFSSLQ